MPDNKQYPDLSRHLMIVDQSDDDTFGALTDHAWDSEFADDLKLNAPLYTQRQVYAAIDADRAMRAAKQVLPEGWVPLTITYEGDYPEELAYGPQRMMDRLKKWLDRYFAMLAAQKVAVAPPSDLDIATLRDKHGITSGGRGIKAFYHVADFVREALALWGVAPTTQAPRDFDAWAESEGLIERGYGVRSESSMLSLARKAWLASSAHALATQAPQPVEPVVSQGQADLLRASLELCVEDSEELINQYIQSYGENYRPERLAYMRKVVADARHALAQPQEAAPEEISKSAARWDWLSDHMQVSWREGKFVSLVRIVSEEWRAALNASVDRMMAGDWSDSDIAQAAPSQDAERLAWVADGWTPGHDALYVAHVLQVGGVGDLSDLRTFIDRMMIAEGRTQAKEGGE